MHARSEEPPPTLDRSDFSAGLCDFVAACLSPAPADRPTAQAMEACAWLAGREPSADGAALREWVRARVAGAEEGAEEGAEDGAAAPPPS